MLHVCDVCGYTTDRKTNLTRHKNRKNGCGDTNNGNINEPNNSRKDFGKICRNVKDACRNVKGDCPNVKDGGGSKFVCVKCSKSLSSKKNLSNHMTICRGVHSLQCPVCFKEFSSAQSKYEHRNNVTCFPPDATFQQQPFSIINRITNSNTITNNNTINNTNCNNQNVHINVFGNEDLSYLSKDKGIIHRLRIYGKEGLYGLPKILDDVHFNKDRPENQTIIKPEEYGNTVLIKNSNNEWEFREFEDIRENMIETIIKYFRAYNEVKKTLNIDLIDEKERIFIRKISYELMALDGFIPLDLFHEVDMNEDNVEDNENALKNKTRKFDKSTIHMIHNRTYHTYKKMNGRYVRK